MTQQTAVEWLIDMISIYIVDEKALPLIDQAKEMEKQHIIHTYWVAYKEGRYSGDKTAEEYYNETYNK